MTTLAQTIFPVYSYLYISILSHVYIMYVGHTEKKIIIKKCCIEYLSLYILKSDLHIIIPALNIMCQPNGIET